MVNLAAIVEKFDLKFIGEVNRKISNVTALSNQIENGLTWAKADKFAEDILYGTLLINDKINFTQK